MTVCREVVHMNTNVRRVIGSVQHVHAITVSRVVYQRLPYNHYVECIGGLVTVTVSKYLCNGDTCIGNISAYNAGVLQSYLVTE